MDPQTGTFACAFELTLTIKNVEEPKICSFNVPATKGQTLLEAMTCYGKNNCSFSFKTKDVPTSGPYVVEVKGVKSGENKFWEALLFKEVTKEVIPLSLRYQVCPGDTVYLRFSLF